MFMQWLRCVIYVMYITFLICPPNIDILTQEALYSRHSFPKQIGASSAEVLKNIRFFSPFYYCLPRVIYKVNSVFLLSQQILIFLHKRLCIYPSFSYAISAVSHRDF